MSRAADLASHGVAVIGPVPGGLPSLGLPALGWHDAGVLLGAAASMFVVIVAQSAATSRAYAVKYEEEFNEDTDLIGLGAANAVAALSGTFVVNGSPTKVLTKVVEHVLQRHLRFVVTTALGPVRLQLDRYGISAALGPNAYYDTPSEALEAFHAAQGMNGD